jgi:Na+-translocating ferredoxin:NAD+ oxidoreductase RnfC subunit
LAKKEVVPVEVSDISITNLPNLYPIGEEHILIKKVLGISLEKNKIPAEMGILVINVQTVLAIQEILKHTYIEGSKYITVADYTTGEAKVVRIKAGMQALRVLQKILGEKSGKDKFIGSGALAGAHLIQENELITDETNMIAYGNIINFSNIDSCIHCGYCSRNCPMNIPVKRIIARKQKNKNADISDFMPDRCLQCATCTYQCRGGINVMQYVK